MVVFAVTRAIATPSLPIGTTGVSAPCAVANTASTSCGAAPIPVTGAPRFWSLTCVIRPPSAVAWDASPALASCERLVSSSFVSSAIAFSRSAPSRASVFASSNGVVPALRTFSTR